MHDGPSVKPSEFQTADCNMGEKNGKFKLNVALLLMSNSTLISVRLSMVSGSTL